MMRFAIPASILLVCPLFAQDWTLATPANNPGALRDAAAAFNMTSGNTVVFGGIDASFARKDETWLFDGTNWTQATPATIPPARSESAMAYDLNRNKVVMFGGSSRLSDTWEWNGTDWTQVIPTTTPNRRQGHCMAFDAARGVVVMFGGAPADPANCAPALTDTWEWNGTNWTQVMTASAPSWSIYGSMCYDFNRQKIVYYGGYDCGVSDQKTWEYDGTNWTDVSATVGNGPWGSALPGIGMTFAPLVYDLNRGVCVLHGGGKPGVGGFGSETWEYDGSSWCHVATDPFPQDVPSGGGSPAGYRTRYVMVYDSVRSKSVLYGGLTGNFQTFYTETWEYVGPAGASFSTFGLGCVGSGGTPTLAAAPGSLPHLGSPFTVDCANLPPTASSAFAVLGFSSFGAPIDLTVIGMDGCNLYISPDFAVSRPVTAGSASWTLNMPTSSAWIGNSLFWQWIAVDPGANPLGAISSNAGEGKLGC